MSRDKPEGSAFTTEAEFEAITKYFQPPTPEEKFNIKTYQNGLKIACSIVQLS